MVAPLNQPASWSLGNLQLLALHHSWTRPHKTYGSISTSRCIILDPRQKDIRLPLNQGLQVYLWGGRCTISPEKRCIMTQRDVRLAESPSCIWLNPGCHQHIRDLMDHCKQWNAMEYTKPPTKWQLDMLMIYIYICLFIDVFIYGYLCIHLYIQCHLEITQDGSHQSVPKSPTTSGFN